MVRTGTQLITDGLSDLVHTVAHHADGRAVGVLVGHGPAAVAHVGVSTGLRDCLPPEQQARAGQVPFADCLGQAVVGAAQ
ncbi:hypothetical protein [Streptomyces sp. NPDC059802]|uniref:hypothetical protein n=1 Tax=Streptomyces sp. NPDC059802 TaxID=3346952 RepID=UPI00365001FB